MASQSLTPKIDRQTTTPFLLKLFYRNGTFHRLDEFSPHASSTPPPHLQIYTWPTCTLRELTHLLLTALPSLLPAPAIGTRLAFRLIFPDTRDATRPGPGRYLSKELGSVVVGAGSASLEDAGDENGDEAAGSGGAGGSGGVKALLEGLEGDAEKTLASARFVIGDYISCAIFPPLSDGAVAAPPPPASAGYRAPGAYGGRGGGAGRENGFAGRGDYGGRGEYGGRGDYGGFRGRGGARYEGGRGGGVPPGEWRRGEVPQGPPGGGYGRGRGRGRGW